MQALDALKYLRENRVYFPWRNKSGLIAQPSNSDLFRWLNEGAVLINGAKPKAKDTIEFPIRELVFFPNNAKTRTTLQ
jgi:hypothetical protein